jgi:hypothetical protein
MTEERKEDIIHESFESGGSITKAKWHNEELIVTLVSLECSLGNFFFLHMNLVVAKVEINFGKILSTT